MGDEPAAGKAGRRRWVPRCRAHSSPSRTLARGPLLRSDKEARHLRRTPSRGRFLQRPCTGLRERRLGRGTTGRGRCRVGQSCSLGRTCMSGSGPLEERARLVSLNSRLHFSSSFFFHGILRRCVCLCEARRGARTELGIGARAGAADPCAAILFW